MRIGIIGQPCIDEIVHTDSHLTPAEFALGGVLYSYAAMERLMRDRGSKNDSFAPLAWLSNPDTPLIEPFLARFNHIERDLGLWRTNSQTNRVQLVYNPNGERSEHCPHVLPPLTELEITPDILSILDGLFVNMISGLDISIEALESALSRTKKRPYVHLDVHALVLGPLSEASPGGGFGSAFIFFVLAGKSPDDALQLAVKWATWNTTLRTIDQIIDSEQHTF